MAPRSVLGLPTVSQSPLREMDGMPAHEGPFTYGSISRWDTVTRKLLCAWWVANCGLVCYETRHPGRLSRALLNRVQGRQDGVGHLSMTETEARGSLPVDVPEDVPPHLRAQFAQLASLFISRPRAEGGGT